MDLPAASVPDASTLRLEVLGKIASGGMARVELAHADDLGQLVALKRLHPHLVRDPEFVAMFMDEAWMTAAVDHPNIVRLLGAGRDDEGPFLVMELCDGPSLQELVDEMGHHGAHAPAELVAYVGLHVARALSAMHELCDGRGRSLGLVHRDLTPSNVLVGADGSVRVTDFGVAKAAGRTSRTSTDVLKGKTRYLSPEYVRHRRVDAKSDFYALGLTLFAMATGRQPFEGLDSVAVFRAILTEQPPPIAEVHRSFDAELSALVVELQRRDPAERPSSAREIERRLTRWLADRGFDEQALREPMSGLVSRYGKKRREILEGLARRRPEGEEGPTVELDDDVLPTHVVYAQLGAPEAQKTRLASVRPRDRATAHGDPLPSALRPSQRSARGGERRSTRVVARPVAADDDMEQPPVAGADDRLTAWEPASRSRRSLWLAVVASSAVAVLAVAAIVLTSPGGERADVAATAPSPGTDDQAMHRADGGSDGDGRVPPAARASTASTSDASFAAAEPTMTPSRRPRPSPGPAKRSVRPRPAPSPVQTSPRQPCDPSHFDYPECLSR